jgi:nucleotide-binding universal stress UspA family protein
VQVSPPDNPEVERTRPGDVPAERRIDRLARSLAGVDGWRVLHDRRPVRALAALAQMTPVAVLVMATRGHKGWTRVLAGSVTTSTVRRAGVPVLAVPARATVEA